jgi:hypothetical protein
VEEPNPVEFNEACNMVQRMNKLQDQLNSSFANLKAYDLERGDYNYNLTFKDLNSYMGELSQELTDAELNKALKVKKLIQSYLSYFELWSKNRKGGKSCNECNLEMLEGALHEYRILLNKYKKAHGLGNPNKRDPRRSVAEMNR